MNVPVWSDQLKRPTKIRVKEIVESFSHTRPSGSKWYTVSNLVYAENLTVGYTSANR